MISVQSLNHKRECGMGDMHNGTPHHTSSQSSPSLTASKSRRWLLAAEAGHSGRWHADAIVSTSAPPCPHRLLPRPSREERPHRNLPAISQQVIG